MATYKHRVQTVLTDEEYDKLSTLAGNTGKPISLLIREAIEQTYLVPERLERRQAALARLLALDAPVADWEQMEQEIVDGALQ